MQHFYKNFNIYFEKKKRKKHTHTQAHTLKKTKKEKNIFKDHKNDNRV